MLEWLRSRLEGSLFRPSDNRTDRKRKMAMFMESVGLLAAVLFGVGGAATEDAADMWYGYEMSWVFVIIVACSRLASLVYIFRAEKVSNGVFFAHLALGMLAVMCFDVYRLSRADATPRVTVMFVVFLDVALVGRLPSGAARILIAAGVAWLVFTEAERTYRFGLLDVWGTVPLAVREEACQCLCDAPPCATGDFGQGVTGALVPISVLVLDFYLTRGFAIREAAEQQRSAAAVATSHEIAAALAGFNLQLARDVLRDSPDLPPGLVVAFTRLLANLESYRSFLPNEFFMKDGSSEAPGVAPDDDVAIVFTDICQSTALWSHSPDAMADALALHDGVIRGAIKAHGGYEVKTSGDSFMVAFASTPSAAWFALTVQARFAEAEWPQALTRMPGAEDGRGADAMEIRIGVHCGKAQARLNPLSGRYDYFGPVVNTAARVEGLAPPGAVALTAAAMKELHWEEGGFEAAGVLQIGYEGLRHGKGLAEPLQLTALLPQEAGRKYALVQSVCGPEAALPNVPARTCLSPALFSDCDDDDDDDESQLASTRSAHSFLSHMVAKRARVATACSVLMFGGVRDGSADSCDPAYQARIAARLQTVARIAAETKGQVSNLMSNALLMSWNVYGTASDHPRLCSAFLAQLFFAADDVSGWWVGAGMATGRVSSSEVSVTANQRFINLWGPAVDLSVTLANAAARRSAVALHGDLCGNAVLPGFGALDSDTEHVVLPADRRRGLTNAVVLLSELAVEGVAAALGPFHEICIDASDCSTVSDGDTERPQHLTVRPDGTPSSARFGDTMHS
eukprot:TRINITY_DN2294_c2_g1_i1.p1 TRINITY_DN2294_c2_g1~~TRINITY_DN2294_c2_g1_i1.p1  ORF type:complete len:827 (+),score=172.57 TRINITY_DN2294_c2_g1_i1:93-2483(+)